MTPSESLFDPTPPIAPSFDVLSAAVGKLVDRTGSGALEMIAIRPLENARRTLIEVECSQRFGIHGDRWARQSWKRLANGEPDPAVQLSLMDARVIELIAGSRERWAMAGDNFFVDLPLGQAALQPGSRLQIGPSLVVEISAEPHQGCRKFATRFGPGAAKFVNHPSYRDKKLRGVYAKILSDGIVRCGDRAVCL